MAPRGGYQAPRRPAPVSGPGSLSRRTDGPGQPQRDLPNAAYGEQKEFQGIQSGARMNAAPPMLPPVTRLDEPTQRPDEPVTAGVDVGPGPGSNVLGIPNPGTQIVQDLENLRKYMPMFERFAQSDYTSGTMKSFVRYLRSQLP